MSSPRLAVRAVIVEAGRLLLVNAYPGERERPLVRARRRRRARARACRTTCAARSHEETGLGIAPGRLLAVSEFHDPTTGFHQVDLFFRARLLDAAGGGGAATTRRAW